MKLQKLVYYSQAWSLVWDEAPLFQEHVQAWANGPVVPELYAAHKGLYSVAPGQIAGNPAALSSEEVETVEAILNHYGDKHSQWLSDLTHAEDPWKLARQKAGLPDGARGTTIITSPPWPSTTAHCEETMAKGQPKVAKHRTALASDRPVKQPHSKDAQPTNYFSWRFGGIDKDGPFAWTSLDDPAEYKDVMERFHCFEGINSARLRTHLVHPRTPKTKKPALAAGSVDNFLAGKLRS